MTPDDCIAILSLFDQLLNVLAVLPFAAFVFRFMGRVL